MSHYHYLITCVDVINMITGRQFYFHRRKGTKKKERVKGTYSRFYSQCLILKVKKMLKVSVLGLVAA